MNKTIYYHVTDSLGRLHVVKGIRSVSSDTRVTVYTDWNESAAAIFYNPVSVIIKEV